MHILEEAFITLLRNHLPIHNKYIFTGSRYIASDHTPCVSVQVADESYIRKSYVEIDHVQHLRRLYNANVWVNIWCSTEEERTSLINAIELRFNQLQASHYTTCSNFNFANEWCSKLDSECEVITSDTGRANKGQCPNVENFTSFFETFNIPQRTFHVNSMTDLDELGDSEPVLRTIFKLEMQYYKFYPIGGRLFDGININVEPMAPPEIKESYLTLNTSKTIYVVGEAITFNGTLLDRYNDPIPGKVVTVNNKDYITNSDGGFTGSLTPTRLGELILNAVYQGDSDYEESSLGMVLNVLISLDSFLSAYTHVVTDLQYNSNTHDWNYIVKPVSEINVLRDLNGCIMNLNKVEGDVQFERFYSSSMSGNITEDELESLSGLLMAIVYDDYTIKYTKL